MSTLLAPSPLDVFTSLTPPSAHAQDGVACNLYVHLACCFRPAAVLPFLLAHTSYDVQRCLAEVQRTGEPRIRAGSESESGGGGVGEHPVKCY